MARKRLDIEYGGDVAGVKRAHNQLDKMHASLGAKLQKFGQGTARVGSSITKYLTLPLVGFGALAVSEFTEAQQANAQTAAALKSTGGAANVTGKEIRDLSDRIADLSAREDDEVQSAENVLLTFTKVRNEAGKGNDIFNQASMAIADLSARLGKDLNSSAIMVGKALNDPIRGVTSLSRAGVQFDEQQKKVIARLVESGDVMGAQKIILRELQTEFAGSAKAAGKSASPIQKLTLAGKDLAESAGKFIVPMLQKAADFVGRLADKFEKLTPAQQETIVKWAGIVAIAGPALVVIGKLVSAVGSITKGIGGLSRGVGGLGSLLSPQGLVIGGIALIAYNMARADAERKQFEKGVQDLTKDLLKGGHATQDFGKAIEESALPAVFKEKFQLEAVEEATRRATKATNERIDSILDGTRVEGRWSDAIKKSAGLSLDQKSKLAALLVTQDRYNVTMSDGAEATFRAFLKTGDYRSALRLLRNSLRGALGPLKNMLTYTQLQGEAAGDAAQNNRRYAYWLSQLHGHGNNPYGGAGGGGGGGGGFQGSGAGGQLARGGPVRRGSTYLVGEAGPELFTASRSGYIHPNGAGGVTVIVNVSNLVSGKRELIDAIHQGLLEKQRRNGGRLGLVA